MKKHLGFQKYCGLFWAVFTLSSSAFAQTINQSGFIIDSNSNFTVTAHTNGSAPAVFDLTNSESGQFTLSITSGTDLSYTLPNGASASLILVQAFGYQLNSSDTNVGPWVNGGNINFTNAANLTLNNAFTEDVFGGILLYSQGSNGYNTGETDLAPYNGNDAGDITATHSGSLTVNGSSDGVSGTTLSAFYAYSLGGNGAEGQNHDTPIAGPGGAGGAVSVTTASGSSISVSNAGDFVTIALNARSEGGTPNSNSGPGGYAGESQPGGTVSVGHYGSITNSAEKGIGILATSIGGDGGTVSYTDGPSNTYYGSSAPGGKVTVTAYGGSQINMTGGGIGILAASTAGASNANAYDEYDATGEDVTVNINSGASISTTSSNAMFGVGVLAISSGTASVLDPFTPRNVATSGSGQAGSATVTNNGGISTQGNMAIGIAALSIGGSGIVATSTDGDINILGNSSYVNVATGADVTVINNGSITTLGPTAHGIVAISAASGGLLNNGVAYGAIVGSNSTAGNYGLNDSYGGGSVTVTNTSDHITTGNGSGGGRASIGIIAQSIGGGGGNAGGSEPAFFVGDAGGNGGSGGSVTVDLTNTTLLTQDVNSHGLLAQSIGGGGGNGANAAGIFVAVGGAGGNGGNGGPVTFNLNSGSITTKGDFSSAIVTHSIGGGGGNGGMADSFGLLLDFAIGGSGGSGGAGGTINATNGGSVKTSGNHSVGLLTQSIGGGGGIGGAATAYSSGVFTAAVSIGGTGGSGGEGGLITAANYGTIVTGVKGGGGTKGADSIGILAQAIGGGGGQGGAATAKSFSFPAGDIPIEISASFAFGGAGGSGGDGGGITVFNSGATAGKPSAVLTYGDGAHGVLAQSIGGGGGTGGDATASSWALVLDAAAVKLSVAHGGSGAVGGDGETVTVYNGPSSDSNDYGPGPGFIATEGENAAGIVAQSIGGGGGNGGTGNASTSSPNLGFSGNSYSTTFAMGGNSSSGGNGGFVDIYNSKGSEIHTRGSGSQGILAQSIGGGGGNAGGGSAAGSGDNVDFNVSLGGKGEGGGTGGDVTVQNDGMITTRGGDAVGILAQSIGGGGGNAGSSDAAASIDKAGQAEDLLNPPSSSYTGQLSIGRNAGGGGNGNTVTITNTGGEVLENGNIVPGIWTQGIRAHGILAQSIGAGGGSGGTATSSSNAVIGGPTYVGKDLKSGTYSANLSIGGGGGSGGNGGQINITNSGVISTQGYGANGIMAHSIGGGGGAGGEGTVDTTTTVGLGGGISRTGGSIGDGGNISITQSGTILTTGIDASGIVAQSIGAGGGSSSTGSPLYTYSTQATAPISENLTTNVTLGGSDLSVGDGGTINITHSGSIGTVGDWSHGIVAQSLGGGGGKSGSSFGAGAPAAISFGIGSALTGEGDGNTVTISLNDAAISTGIADASGETSGYSAYGIVAQSIGGGGGMATDNSQTATSATENGITGIQAGQNGSGNANTVSLSGDATISTTGEAAHAIVLQSIGGGGGIGAQGSTDGDIGGSGVRVSAGGLDGGAGTGGSVTIDDAVLNITTSGNNAYGILAQSVGGGGGLAFAQNAGEAYVGGQNNTADNFGGTVSIALNEGSAITTQGDGAHAIIAQSVGGGGGIVNYPTGDIQFDTSPGRSNNAPYGTGGEVEVSVDANIETNGDGAFGILAQSVGSGGGLIANGNTVNVGSTSASGATGSGFPVTVTQSGSIATNGENSVGIFAQSVDTKAGESVSVTVNGPVQGGSGDNGYGVWVSNGQSGGNQLTVGTGGSVGALSGNAINYTGPFTLDVQNDGSVFGSTNLNGGAFTNNGTYSLSGGPTTAKARVANRQTATFESATINGDFEQTNNGAIVVDTDFKRGRADHLRITGDAKLDGVIRTQTASVQPFSEIPVLRIDGKVSGDLDAEVVGASSEIFRFDLDRRGKEFFLTLADVDFGAGLSLGYNQRMVANHLDSIWQAGGNAKFDRLFNVLNRTTSKSDYASYLAQMSAGPTLGLTARRTADMQAFASQALNSSSIFSPNPLKEGEAFWGRMTGRHANQSGNYGTSNFDVNELLWTVGGQTEVAPGWFVGGVAAYEHSWFSSDDGLSSGDGDSGLGAVTVKYETDPWLFAGALFGSFGFYETERNILIPGFQGNAEGSPDVFSTGFTLKAAYTWGTEQFYFRPSLELSTIYVYSGSYRETGGSTLGLDVKSSDMVTFIATPALEIGGKLEAWPGVVLRPYMTAGISFLTDDQWNQSARLTGSPGGASDFDTAIPMDNIAGRITTGVEYQATERISLSLQYEGEYSGNLNAHGGSFSTSIRF